MDNASSEEKPIIIARRKWAIQVPARDFIHNLSPDEGRHLPLIMQTLEKMGFQKIMETYGYGIYKNPFPPSQGHEERRSLWAHPAGLLVRLEGSPSQKDRVETIEIKGEFNSGIGNANYSAFSHAAQGSGGSNWSLDGTTIWDKSISVRDLHQMCRRLSNIQRYARIVPFEEWSHTTAKSLYLNHHHYTSFSFDDACAIHENDESLDKSRVLAGWQSLVDNAPIGLSCILAERPPFDENPAPVKINQRPWYQVEPALQLFQGPSREAGINWFSKKDSNLLTAWSNHILDYKASVFSRPDIIFARGPGQMAFPWALARCVGGNNAQDNPSRLAQLIGRAPLHILEDWIDRPDIQGMNLPLRMIEAIGMREHRAGGSLLSQANRLEHMKPAFEALVARVGHRLDLSAGAKPLVSWLEDWLAPEKEDDKMDWAKISQASEIISLVDILDAAQVRWVDLDDPMQFQALHRIATSSDPLMEAAGLADWAAALQARLIGHGSFSARHPSRPKSRL